VTVDPGTPEGVVPILVSIKSVGFDAELELVATALLFPRLFPRLQIIALKKRDWETHAISLHGQNRRSLR
jgi:hypothetical protein